MNKKILFSIIGVIAIIGTTLGITYAYYLAQTSASISGNVEKGILSQLTVTTVKSSTNLVPLQDSKISTAIKDGNKNGKCVDNNKYEVCSLYTITLKNTDSSENLYGYVKASEKLNTSNLRYQVFDSSYNAITDIMTISGTANSYTYFKKGSTQVSIASTGTKTYYLAIWLHDTNSDQSADYSQTFTGAVGFELVGASSNRLEATLA